MNIKIKKLSNLAVLPAKATYGSAGFDLVSTDITTEINEVGEVILVYHTGIALEIPKGYVGLLFPRSSVYKKSLHMCNNVGVIDSDFRGEICGKFRTTVPVVPSIFKVGDRFAQIVIMPIPEVEFEETEQLTETDRGEDGFGSTDSSAPTGSQSLPENEGKPTNFETANEGSGGEGRTTDTEVSSENVPEQV